MNIPLLKTMTEQGTEVHTCHPSTWEAEGGGLQIESRLGSIARGTNPQIQCQVARESASQPLTALELKYRLHTELNRRGSVASTCLSLEKR